ncbi:MAG: amidohydrolase [Chitinophagales bacterium]|nr:amidohydrolase [Bacteroidota bacterium]MBX7140088.1 amidohydrolase [Chitinophagales bacterium]
MRKIDIHTHIIPEHLPKWGEKFGYGGFIHLEHHKNCRAKMMVDDKFFREIESNCWDPQQRIKECDHHHVDVQVLSTIPVMFSYWAKPQDCLDVSRFLNDHIAQVVKNFPKRFIGLGTLPMHAPELAVKELERCVKELGLTGIQIGSNVNQLNLNEPQFFDIFKAAEELGACVFIHPWEMMGRNDMQKYWLPWLVGMPAETSRAICSMIFGGVLERLPKLRVAFAHGGGSFPATFARIAHGFDERPDLVAVDNPNHPKNYLGKFWLDSLTHDERMLQYIIDFAGEDKICLGSDYPFPLGELKPGKLIEEADLKKKLKKKLLWENAFEWLGIPEIK